MRDVLLSLVILMILLLYITRHKEGLQKQTKDIIIKKNLPSNVSYVVKKVNGEYVVKFKDGTEKRYKKGATLPAYLKPGYRPPGSSGSPSSASHTAAVTRMEQQIKKLQTSIDKLRDDSEEDASDKKMLEQIKSIIEGKLGSLQDGGPGGAGYVDGGDAWILK